MFPNLSLFYHRMVITMLRATHPALLFHRINQVSWYRQLLQHWVDSLQLPAHSSILEAGCATGILAQYLATRGHRVTAIDGNQKMIEMAQNQAINKPNSNPNPHTNNNAVNQSIN